MALALACGAQPILEPLPAQPSEMPVALPPEAVLEAGDQMARILATSDAVPADLDITLDRVRIRASAGQCFLLFCEFLAAWYAQGSYPDQSRLERFSITAQAGQDAAAPMAAPPQARERLPAVQTSRLLAQCGPAADMVRRTHTLPGGIWVQGHRLRTAEFLGATATILQQLRYFGVCPDLVAVRPFSPPPSWVEALAAARASLPGEQPESGPPVLAEAPAPQPPALRLIPGQDQVVTGLAPITAIYRGPRAFLRILIDGKIVAVSNVSPFTFVWDTRLDAEGSHAVAAEAVSDGKIVAQAALALTADNGGPTL